MIRSILPGILAVTATSRAAKTGWASAALLAALTKFTYVALVGVLVIAGLGVPIPEDIPLVLSGYMCNDEYSPICQIEVDDDKDGIPDRFRTAPDLYLMMAAGMLGVLIGDSIVFNIGRHGIESNNMVARHLRKVMHTKRRERVERHFARHGNLTVFAGRFAPGFRSIVFAFAGLSKMSYARFILIDGLAALISVPFFVWLGYHFAGHIDTVRIWIEKIKHILFPVVLVIIAGLVLIYFLRRKRRVAAVENL